MNLAQRIGGNANLSDRGRMVNIWLPKINFLTIFEICFILKNKKYSDKLAEFVKKESLADLVVWTSQMKRTIQTASKIEAPKEQWKALNEIYAV